MKILILFLRIGMTNGDVDMMSGWRDDSSSVDYNT
jgi:hypothetical protein